MAPASQSLGRATLSCLVAAVLPFAGDAAPDVLVTDRPVVPVLRDIDPLALLLDNMRPIAAQQAAQVSFLPRGGAPAADVLAGTVPLPVQAASIFQAIGDASGVLGEAGHFQIEESADGMRITAPLPGHRLGTGGPRGKHPLHVRVVNRTLIVKGAHETPPVVKEFQRSFHLPKRAVLSGIQVDYSTSSEKLVITVPMRLAADGQAEADEEDESPWLENSDKSERFADVEESMRKFFEDSSRLSLGAPPGASLRGRPAKRAEEVLGLFDQIVARGVEHEEVAAVTMFDPSEVYILESVGAPGRYLNVGGAQTRDGAGIQVWSNPEAAETRWRIMEQPGLMFNIENVNAEREFVNIAEHPEEDGSWKVHLSQNHLSLTSLWHITQTATGAFTFESELADGKYLNLLAEANGSAADGALVRLWGSQANTSQWRIFKETAARKDNVTRWAPGKAAREEALQRGRERAVWHLGEDEDGSPMLEVHAPSGEGLRHESGRLLAVPTLPSLPGGEDGGPSSAPAPQTEVGTNVGVPLALSERDCDASPDRSAMRCRLPKSHVREVPVRWTKDEL